MTLTGIEDIDFYMLLKLDINTLKSICITNKIALNKYCNNKNFWLQYFQINNIIIDENIIPKNLNDWIYYYNAGKMAIKVILISQATAFNNINMIYITIKNRKKYQNLWTIMSKKLTYTHVDFSEVYSIYKQIKLKLYHNKYYIFFNTKNLRSEDEYFTIEDENIDPDAYPDSYRVELTYYELINVLTAIIYDENFTDIRDSEHISFFKKNLQPDVPTDENRLGMLTLMDFLMEQNMLKF